MDQSPFSRGDEKRTGRWAHLSGGDATLLSSHAGRFAASGGRQKACCPRRAPTLRAKPPDEHQPDTEATVRSTTSKNGQRKGCRSGHRLTVLTVDNGISSPRTLPERRSTRELPARV